MNCFIPGSVGFCRAPLHIFFICPLPMARSVAPASGGELGSAVDWFAARPRVLVRDERNPDLPRHFRGLVRPPALDPAGIRRAHLTLGHLLGRAAGQGITPGGSRTAAPDSGRPRAAGRCHQASLNPAARSVQPNRRRCADDPFVIGRSAPLSRTAFLDRDRNPRWDGHLRAGRRGWRPSMEPSAGMMVGRRVCGRWGQRTRPSNYSILNE